MRLRLLLLLLVGLGVYLAVRPSRTVWAYPAPEPATPTPGTPDCTFPSSGSPVLSAIDSSTTGGFHEATEIIVDASTRISLESSLTLIADDRLEMNGKISFVPNPGVVANVTLVCRNGPVIIGPGAQIGFWLEYASAGRNATVHAPRAVARAGAGTNGGVIKLVALQASIDVRGEIYAFCGGTGGTALAQGVLSAWPWGRQGRATAVGGQGGAGGDVIFCAYEAINIGGKVMAGAGGEGGRAEATATAGEAAEAVAGPGNKSGDVYFHGLDPNCQVFLNADVNALDGGDGGEAYAQGGVGDTASRGGDARAEGGTGSIGGTVGFVRCAATTPGTVFSGDAGEGEPGEAVGGTGGAAGVWGRGGDGGDADAYGGDAGIPGAVVTIPLTDGTTATGIGPSGLYSGATATATGGDGGVGGIALGGAGGVGVGGRSGQGLAQGGAGERTRVKPPLVVSAPVAPVFVPGALPGGVAVPAVSPGSP